MTNPLKEEAQNHDEDAEIRKRAPNVIRRWMDEWLEEQREERGEY